MDDLIAKSLFFPFVKVELLTIGCASKTRTQRLAQKGKGEDDWNYALGFDPNALDNCVLLIDA